MQLACCVLYGVIETLPYLVAMIFPSLLHCCHEQGLPTSTKHIPGEPGMLLLQKLASQVASLTD